MSAARIFWVLFFIAFGRGLAFAQAADSVSTADSIPHVPGKNIQVTAARASSLATVEARGIEIKPTRDLVRESGSLIASDALRAISSSLDIRRYGTLGSMAVPSFRGLPEEFTTVYRDGIPVTNEQLGETDLGQLTLHGISSVELIPSSTAVLLGGDAIGAAIDLISEAVTQNALTLGTEQTSYSDLHGWPENSYYAKAGLKVLPNLSISAIGSLDQSTGAFPFFQDPAHPSVIRSNDSAALRSASLNASWQANDHTTIGLNSNYFYASRGDPGTAITPGYGADFPEAHQEDRQTFLLLHANHDWQRWSGNISTSYQSQFENYLDPPAGEHDSSTNAMYGVDARADVRIATWLHGYAGTEYLHTKLQSTTNVSPAGGGSISRGRLNGYLAGLAIPFETLHLSASVRSEYLSDLSLLKMLPQAFAEYEVLPGLDINAAFSRSFQAPTLNDLYWNPGGNPNLKPEQSDNWQIAVDYKHNWNFLRAEAVITYFNAHIQNEIVWVPFSAIWRPVNVGDVRSSGFEFRISAQAELGKQWHASIDESYTLDNAINRSQGDVNFGKQLEYTSPTSSLFIAQIEQDECGSAALLVRSRGNEFSDPANTGLGILPAATTYDLTLSSRTFEIESIGIRALLSIQNLTDLRYTVLPNEPSPGETLYVPYEDVLNYPLPGRSYKFSIELTYR